MAVDAVGHSLWRRTMNARRITLRSLVRRGVCFGRFRQRTWRDHGLCPCGSIVDWYQKGGHIILNSVQKRNLDTFDGAKPRFSNRGQKRRSVSTLSIPRALARGVELATLYIDRKSVSIRGGNRGRSLSFKNKLHAQDQGTNLVTKIDSKVS
jgi:hypothetical protein